MKIVITGGLGYIGSALIERFQAYNHEIIVLDNFSTSLEKTPNCDVIKCDITSVDSLKEIKISGCDVLLHLAAQSSGPKSFFNADLDIKINVLGTLNMINWCRENDIGRIIFASSFVVYGDNEQTDILSETEPCVPKSIYALSKYTSEQLLQIFAEPHGIKWNVLRMFNVYGPGQDLLRTDQGMVSIFLKLIKDNNYVGVQGSLDRFRDFIHIDDVVSGWELCLKNDLYHNQTYNLGSGEKTNISTLINILIDAFDKTGQVTVEEVEATPGDIMGCYADISKIKKHFGFNPEYNPNTGIRHMVEWANNLE
jgi:UDP-glucose 4-epimerase